jgi:hypothetical protein
MENDVKSFDFGVELLEKSGQIPCFLMVEIY